MVKNATSIQRRPAQRGAVSLFVVIFSAMLLTIVAVSFARIVLREQQQSSHDDLSRSAYDSAMAGVEDAKRALLRHKQVCSNGNNAECARISAVLNAKQCNTLQQIGVVAGNSEEVLIQQHKTHDALLDQAYTCVKINLDTETYEGSLPPGGSKLIPLASVGPFTRVQVEWFTRQDASNANAQADTVDLPSGGDVSLPAAGTGPQTPGHWPANRPALLRAALIQYAGTVSLEAFDGDNARTLFLYPSPIGIASLSFADDVRRSPIASNPVRVPCQGSLVQANYACRADIAVPPPSGGSADNRTAFLHLAALYSASHYRISLLHDGGAPVRFNGVQPSVDSTGRANHLFRRVESRVELTSDVVHPDAALETTQSLCKNFTVTDKEGDFNNACRWD